MRPAALALLLLAPVRLAGCTDKSTYWLLFENSSTEAVGFTVLSDANEEVCKGELAPHPNPGPVAAASPRPSASGVSYFGDRWFDFLVTY